ncbi:hypothetical protein ACIXR5_12525 [Bacteroides fragilis]|nr:MAG TPA: hypothetical protein [Caudoviricetes sp.]
MMKETIKDIDADIADIIMSVPRGFKVGKRKFYLYPITLGKTYLISRLMSSLNINLKIVHANPYMEALRLCQDKKNIVCRILSYHTINKKKDLFDNDLIQERCDFFIKELDNESLAQLLVMVLSEGDISQFTKHLGIDKEKEWQEKAMKAKRDNNSFVFGGKSIYGTLISSACERYGWTFEYVVWGISYANLQLLLADSITSIYLSDEERKRVNIPKDRNVINADDPANMARIKAMKWD